MLSLRPEDAALFLKFALLGLGFVLLLWAISYIIRIDLAPGYRRFLLVVQFVLLLIGFLTSFVEPALLWAILAASVLTFWLSWRAHPEFRMWVCQACAATVLMCLLGLMPL